MFMKSKFLLYAALATLGAGFTACDEDNDQIIDVEPNDEQLLVASNTTGKITKIQTDEVDELSNVERVDITVPYADGDGVGVRGDDAYVVNRTGNTFHLLENVFSDDNEVTARVGATSPVSISNARGIAIDREVEGNNIAVVQSGNATNGNVNKIFLFDGARTDLDLRAEVTVPFALWGVEWDGSDLIAVVDFSDSLAVFENFDDATTGTLNPSYYIKVEGLTRTHGITFENDDDILILTDIGDAASNSDGAFHFVPNWRGAAKAAAKGSGTLALDRQRRVSGAATMLGNPVDVAYDDDNNVVYIAERLRDGGRLLGFRVPEANGSPAPVLNLEVAGASSVDYRD